MFKSETWNYNMPTQTNGVANLREAVGNVTDDVRELLAITVTFWRDRKKDDALKMLRDTLTRMDELDNILSSESIDQAAALATAKQVGGGCQSCHSLYREQIPGTKGYRVKDGSRQ